MINNTMICNKAIYSTSIPYWQYVETRIRSFQLLLIFPASVRTFQLHRVLSNFILSDFMSDFPTSRFFELPFPTTPFFFFVNILFKIKNNPCTIIFIHFSGLGEIPEWNFWKIQDEVVNFSSFQNFFDYHLNEWIRY